jgi:vacuolar-type H+-ATPase subunit B/Vma2
MPVMADIDQLDAPDLPPGSPIRLSAAAPALWRVIDGSGRVIGHLQAVAAGAGIRYRARRFHPASRAFRELGEFWSAGDAIDCLRFAR